MPPTLAEALRLMTGESGGYVDRVEDDSCRAVDEHGLPIEISHFAIRRRGRQAVNQGRREWLEPFFPAWRQGSGAIKLFGQSRREVPGTAVIASNQLVILLPEVAMAAMIMATTMIVVVIATMAMMVFAVIVIAVAVIIAIMPMLRKSEAVS